MMDGNRLRSRKSGSLGALVGIVAVMILAIDQGAQSQTSDDENQDLSRNESLLLVLDPVAAELLQQSLWLKRSDDLLGAAQAYSEAAQYDDRVVQCARFGTLPSALMRSYDMSAHAESYANRFVPHTLLELDRILAENPTDPQALRERALLFRAVGHWQRVEDDLWLALETDPYPAAVKVLLARHYLDKEELFRSRVIGALMSDSELPAPTEEEQHELLYLPLELAQEAIDAGATGLLVDLTFAEALMNTTEFYDDHSVTSQVITVLEQAREKLPVLARDLIELEQSAMVFMWLGHSYYVAGNIEESTASMLSYERSEAADSLCGVSRE